MPAAILSAALLAVWELCVRLGAVDELLLAAPSSIARSLVEDAEILFPDMLVTAGETVLGLLASVVVGSSIALAMHRWDVVRRALYPLVIGTQAVPVVVIAPAMILLLGFGLAPKVAVIALICFFPIAIGLFDGLRSAERDQRKLMRALHADRRQTLRWLELPAALPLAFTGLRVATAFGVIGAVFAEWTGSSEGLGHLLLTAGGQLETARVWAATFLLFVLAIALYGAVGLLERRVVTWKEPR
jgi:NitT/TauT family transport system permease protein/putative hydroxymethylpyrimidine transport system permease protein